MQQRRRLLRVRNHFVLQAQSSSSERLHAVSLLVQLRERDVAHFNHSSSDHAARDSVDFVEHLLELLDDDPDFQQIVQDLDALRPSEAPSSSSKNSNGATYKLIASSQWMKVQWRALDPQTSRSLGNVLQRTHKRRSDCFSREDDAEQSARKAQQASSEDEVYAGGMYKPLPMRKLTIEVWMYPPHVAIPATGNRIPADDTSVADFFQTVES